MPQHNFNFDTSLEESFNRLISLMGARTKTECVRRAIVETEKSYLEALCTKEQLQLLKETRLPDDFWSSLREMSKARRESNSGQMSQGDSE